MLLFLSNQKVLMLVKNLSSSIQTYICLRTKKGNLMILAKYLMKDSGDLIMNLA